MHAAFIPLAVAEDPHSQQNYHLKLDEELKNTLHEAVAKKVRFPTKFMHTTQF